MKDSFKYILIMIFSILLLAIINNTAVAQPMSTWEVRVLNNPDPGYLRFDFGDQIGFFLVDNYGTIKFQDTNIKKRAAHFSLLENGLWASLNYDKYLIYDQDLNLVDSILGLPNYKLDWHDVISLSNGHYLILFTEELVMDLSNVIAGGKTDASVLTNIIIETDTKGNIYWTWKAIDHLAITDVTEDVDLTQQTIDFSHINSFVEDTDGNIVVSLRNFDEIVKINKTNGNLIWRFGGTSSKNNEFTILDDNINGFKGFSHQHSITILSNGNLLMFDNGSLKPTQYSRVVEYQLDQVNKKATKVWEYRNNPDIFTQVMGSAYRLSNGNTLINWPFDKITEVTPDKTIAFEIDFSNVRSDIYKAKKYITKMNAVIKSISNIGNYSFNDSKFTTGLDLSLIQLNGSGTVSVEKHNYAPPNLEIIDTTFSSVYPFRWVLNQRGINSFTGYLKLKASTIANLINPNELALYFRPNETWGEFTELETTYNSSTDEITAYVTRFGEYILGSKVLGIQYLSSPANNEVGVPSTGYVKWVKQPGAKNYQVQIANSSTFEHIDVNAYSANQLDYNYQSLDYNTKYYWRVRASNNYETTEWSEVWSFSTAFSAPKLLTPTNKYVGSKLNDSLTWTKVQGAENYWIQLSKNQDFSNLIIDNKKVPTEFISLSDLQNNSKYYWRVLAYNKKDTSIWSQFFSFTTKLDVAQLESPSNESVNIPVNGVLTWVPVNGAENYSLEVSQTSTFVNCDYKANKLVKPSSEYSGLKYGKTYFWRVKASRSTDESDWSKIWQFTTSLAAPTLISPIKGEIVKVNDTRFSWSNDTSKVTYRLQISRTNDFSTTLVDYSKLTYYKLTMLELPANTVLYWRVMMMNGLQQSDWSEVWNVKTGNSLPIDDPMLLSPVNNSENNNYGTFSWGKVSRAFRYKLQVSTSNDFKNMVIDSVNYGQLYFNYSDFQNSKLYYWRIKAYSLYDSSKWSNTWSINTAKLSLVKLVSPRNEQLSVPIIGSVIWRTESGIQSYMLQISENPEFNKPVIDAVNLTDTVYNFSALKQYTQYFWRVRYILNGETSNWTNARTFTTESQIILSSPKLVKPTNFQSMIRLDGDLTWSRHDSADYYRVEISKTRDFEIVVFKFSNIIDTLVSYTGLEYNQTYYWRVSAFSHDGSSPWSQSRLFTTELPVPTIISPIDNAIDQPYIGNLEWDFIQNVDAYYVQICEDTLFTNNLIYTKVYYPYYQYTLEPYKSYYWRTFSFNFGNYSDWTKPYKFTTSDPTNVEILNNEINFVIYPNPAIEKIIFDNDSYLGNSFKIYDLNGNSMIENILTNNYIDISWLCSGSYYLVIGNNSKMFIKN